MKRVRITAVVLSMMILFSMVMANKTKTVYADEVEETTPIHFLTTITIPHLLPRTTGSFQSAGGLKGLPGTELTELPQFLRIFDSFFTQSACVTMTYYHQNH